MLQTYQIRSPRDNPSRPSFRPYQAFPVFSYRFLVRQGTAGQPGDYTLYGDNTFGVTQIQKNNLRFRFEYQGNDEFLPVCNVFNEMMARLETLANEQKKYEENRRELIAGISHDLRTPLTSIKAYLEGLEKGIASTPEMWEKYFTTIKNKTNDLEHIINQLFLFSKLDINDFPLNLKTIDIGMFISGMVSELSGEYAKRGLAVDASGVTRNLYADIDPMLFRNVIVNILENSAAYKDAEQGRIEITTDRAGSMVV